MKPILLCFLIGASPSALAEEPLGPFPDRCAPADIEDAPRNTLLWVFGRNPPADVDLRIVYGGGSVFVPREGLTALASTGFVVDPIDVLNFGFIEGDNVELTFQTGTPNELTCAFSVGAEDETKPTLDEAVVIGVNNGNLTVVVSGSDDIGLAGVFARREGLVIGASAVGRQLVAPGPCFEVSVVDLANNESTEQTICDDDLVEPDADGQDDDGGGCAASPWSGVIVLAGLLLLPRRKKRGGG